MILQSTRIRILHVITALPIGGAEMMLLKLLSATHGKYVQAVVSGKDEGTIGPRIKELGVPVHTLGLHPVAPNPLCAFSIRSLVREFRPHVIQGWMPHGNLVASFAGISSRDRVPVLWNIRMSLSDTHEEPRLTRTVIRLGALLSWHPKAIIYNSYYGAQQHGALGYRASKQVVIPNGFDCQVFRPDEKARRQVRTELGVSDDTILVGLVARYHPMKDHAGFLQAAGSVARSHPEAHFMLIGKGLTTEEPTLAKLIAEGQLKNRTSLLDERLDIAHLTAALDIACSSSAWGEGFSNAIGEAMACGVPCVVTDVGDSAYAVADTGFSVPPREPQALAEAIGRLISVGETGRRRLGEAARQRVESNFSLPAIARKYEDLYRQHLDASSQPLV